MKKILRQISGLVMVALLVAPVVSAPVAAAPVDVLNQSCAQSSGSGDSELCQANDDALFGPDSFWTRIVNAMIFVTAALSVLMIIIGGFRYTTSGGDQSSLTSAKNTILYSVIGLVVALVAYALVNFVLSSVIS